MDFNQQKPRGGRWLLIVGALLTIGMLIAIVVLLITVFTSGVPNSAQSPKSGFEGLSTTKHVRDPWRLANPYTMMMR